MIKKFLNIFRTKYRIVTDNFSGFEAQDWKWYRPLWMQMGFSNTHISEAEAIKYIKKKTQKRRVISHPEI